jgi:hypothetical protein
MTDLQFATLTTQLNFMTGCIIVSIVYRMIGDLIKWSINTMTNHI